MNQFTYLAIRLATVFVIIFFLTQPYNWFCQMTQKCSPFFFSYLIPSFEGKNPIEINFVAKNYNKELVFEALEPHVTAVTNRIITVSYKVKNVSGRFVRFRIKLTTEPNIPEEYGFIKMYQCLCDKEYKLIKGEERIIETKLKLNPKFDKVFFNDAKTDSKQYKTTSPSLRIIYEALKY